MSFSHEMALGISLGVTGTIAALILIKIAWPIAVGIICQ